MKLNKKVIQCVAVLGLMSTFAITAVTSSNKADQVSDKVSVEESQSK